MRPHPAIWSLVCGKNFYEKLSLIANVMKLDPILGVYTFLTHFNIPEVNVSTSPIHRRGEAILCNESWLCKFDAFIVTHQSLLTLGDYTSEDCYWDIFSDLALLHAHAGYIWAEVFDRNNAPLGQRSCKVILSFKNSRSRSIFSFSLEA